MGLSNGLTAQHDVSRQTHAIRYEVYPGTCYIRVNEGQKLKAVQYYQVLGQYLRFTIRYNVVFCILNCSLHSSKSSTPTVRAPMHHRM